MELIVYQINAFTEQLEGGNPACVVELQYWLENDLLLKIAKANAVSETAFFIQKGTHFHLRWFTPEVEMDLCGHATLATAHVLKTILQHHENSFKFDTLSGELTVNVNDHIYCLNFPARKPIVSDIPEIILHSINLKPKEILKSRDYVLVYETEHEIKNIVIEKPVFDQINLDPGGVVVTAKGDECDFVSRYFTPQSSILEDPVTGSAHCSLIPYWGEKLKKKTLIAKQLSERQGTLFCVDKGNRVEISGYAKTFSTFTLNTEFL